MDANSVINLIIHYIVIKFLISIKVLHFYVSEPVASAANISTPSAIQCMILITIMLTISCNEWIVGNQYWLSIKSGLQLMKLPFFTSTLVFLYLTKLFSYLCRNITIEYTGKNRIPQILMLRQLFHWLTNRVNASFSSH